MKKLILILVAAAVSLTALEAQTPNRYYVFSETPNQLVEDLTFESIQLFNGTTAEIETKNAGVSPLLPGELAISNDDRFIQARFGAGDHGFAPFLNQLTWREAEAWSTNGFDELEGGRYHPARILVSGAGDAKYNGTYQFVPVSLTPARDVSPSSPIDGSVTGYYAKILSPINDENYYATPVHEAEFPTLVGSITGWRFTDDAYFSTFDEVPEATAATSILLPQVWTADEASGPVPTVTDASDVGVEHIISKAVTSEPLILAGGHIALALTPRGGWGTLLVPSLKRTGSGDGDFAEVETIQMLLTVPYEDLPTGSTISVLGVGAQGHNTLLALIGSSSIAPSGTTETIDWRDGPFALLSLASASGNVTLTLSNPSVGQLYFIKVTQGATPRTLTFPSGTTQSLGVGNVWTSSGASKVDIITLIYDGTNYHILGTSPDQG